jgi:hypothetical protein
MALLIEAAIAIYLTVIRAVITRPRASHQRYRIRPRRELAIAPSEAIATEPGQPAHDGCVLITLGEIPPGHTAVTIEVRRYERTGATTTVGISLRRTAATWEPVLLPAR